MRTGIVISTGIAGVLFLVIVVILAVILKIRFFEIRSKNKKAMRFFIIMYLITAFICLGGSGLGYMELLSIPILWIINFIPVPISLLSAIYIKKSKRFKDAK